MSAVVRNIVLVHGAFADGSSWSKVIPYLSKWDTARSPCRTLCFHWLMKSPSQRESSHFRTVL
jgi:hypothetical protein